MARDIDSPNRSDERTGGERTLEPPRPEERRSAPSRDPEPRTGRGYAYFLSPAELETMQEIGRFRTLATQDLAAGPYKGSASEMQEDLRSLINQGLVERRALWTESGQKLTLIVLTKRGKEILEREGKVQPGQQLYAGFVKPAEVAHDAAIYRMFQAEARHIERQGGRIRRIVLDYELKQKVYAPLAKARALRASEYAKRQAEIARQNALPLIRGKIALPDLRIEYQTQSGEMARVDLELATHHYHGPQLQAKVEAGFKMYCPADSAGQLRAALEEREITAEILSL